MRFFRVYHPKKLTTICLLIGLVFALFFTATQMSGRSHFLTSNTIDMTFTPEGDTLIINGETQNDSLVKFRAALEKYPQTQKIILNIVPGSDDDEVNLKMARVIRRHQLSTHLTSSSVIESGGVELFMGGVERTMERGAKIGVHSWSDDEGYEGHQLPKDHNDHKLYIKTYQKLGIPKSFYWFVINAAPSSGMHFMSEEEIVRYNLLTRPVLQP